MIQLETTNIFTRWFVWCCDYLPLTTGYFPQANGSTKEPIPKPGAYYIMSGTTLCHVFWATLWVPLIIVAFGGFMLSMVALMHVEVHYEFVAQHPFASPALKTASYLIPEAVMLAAATAVLIVILAVIGGAKTGFFTLLWQYFKGVKSRICPLVKFELNGEMTSPH